MALAVILLTLAQKLPENYGGMKVNNLIGVVEDWGTGAVIAAAKVAGHLGRPFELQYESWETREHCRTIGSQRMLRQAIDLFNEEKLELDAKPFKVGGTEASREAPSMERALQDIRAKLTYLSVTDGRHAERDKGLEVIVAGSFGADAKNQDCSGIAGASGVQIVASLDLGR